MPGGGPTGNAGGAGMIAGVGVGGAGCAAAVCGGCAVAQALKAAAVSSGAAIRFKKEEDRPAMAQAASCGLVVRNSIFLS